MTALPDHLTAIDGTFLELEDADSAAHMHIGGLLVFGPRAGGETPGARGGARVPRASASMHCRAIASASPRRRTGGLSWQRVGRRRALRHGAARARERRFRRRAASTRCWPGRASSGRSGSTRACRCGAVVVLDGLAGGRWALVTKTHHCLVDGVGSVDAAHAAARRRAEARARGQPAAARSARERAARARIRRLAGPAHGRRRGGPRRRRAIPRAPPRCSSPRAGSSSCCCATRSWPRRRRASTTRSASIAGLRYRGRRSTSSRRSSVRSAGPSTTSSSRSSTAGLRDLLDGARRGHRPTGRSAGDGARERPRRGASTRRARQPHHLAVRRPAGRRRRAAARAIGASRAETMRLKASLPGRRQAACSSTSPASRRPSCTACSPSRCSRRGCST